MPRSNRPRRPRGSRDSAGGAPPPLPANGGTRVRYAGGEWVARPITGDGATREYRCPGCQQLIPVGTPHIVAWPDHGLGSVEQRRHWHTACWAARDTRPPLGSFR